MKTDKSAVRPSVIEKDLWKHLHSFSHSLSNTKNETMALNTGELFGERSKGRDVRTSNIVAAKVRGT